MDLLLFTRLFSVIIKDPFFLNDAYILFGIEYLNYVDLFIGSKNNPKVTQIHQMN